MMNRRPAFTPGARVAVLGLGVSGSAAARLARTAGAEVYASDIASGPGRDASAEQLRSEGIEAESGGHDIDRILACELVVTSPGISPRSEIRQAVSAAGIPTIAEVELAYRSLSSRIVAITGTNGKTTTTHLTTHLLTEAGIDAEAVGNVGRPLSECASAERQPEWVVVELSSFQLADLVTFEADIGVLLNLAPDHLDWYPDVEAYYADKARLFERAVSDPRWVLNAEDTTVLEMAAPARGRQYLFSTSGEVPAGAWCDARGRIVGRLDSDDEFERWAEVGDVPLLGRHNLSNVLAACVTAVLAGAGVESLAGSLRSFRGLPHRLRPVADRGGVLWVNDSKATNVAAAVAAVTAFDRPLVLLLGGRHKGQPYARLAAVARDRAKAVIAFGEAAPLIVSEFGDSVRTLHVEPGLEAAVHRAEELAVPGDVVLLAPACSSFDMFSDYAERGRAFEAAVGALRAVEPAS